MTSRLHSGAHLAAAVVATAAMAAACGGVNKPTPQGPTAGVKYGGPKRTTTPQLIYPPTLKTQGIEADIPVLLFLDENGRVVNVKILEASQYPELNEAVRRTAMSEEFESATRDGVPMACSIKFTYRFRLERK